MSQTSLFGDAVESFAQQFSTAQEQTEVIRHVLHWRAAAVSISPPVAVPQPARHQGWPPVSVSNPVLHPQQPPAKQRCRAVRRSPLNLAVSGIARGPGLGDQEREGTALREMGNTPLPPMEEGPVEDLLFPKILTLEQFSLSLGPRRTRRVADGPTPNHTHPTLSPEGSNGQFERVFKGPTHVPSAQQWNQVSVSQHTQNPLRTSYDPPKLGPSVPPCCPTVGTSVVPLVQLAAWLALPNPSRWLLTRLCNSVHLASPQVQGYSLHISESTDAHVLHAEIAVLLAKDTMEPAPPSDMKTGFYSTYFIVPKKGGGFRPILDLHVLNRALHKLPFKLLTQKCIFECIRPQDWFAAIDLKDTYFHVSILPRHRPFEHFSSRSCPSGCPCRPVSSRMLRKQPLFPRESRASVFSLTSGTGSY